MKIQFRCRNGCSGAGSSPIAQHTAAVLSYPDSFPIDRAASSAMPNSAHRSMKIRLVLIYMLAPKGVNPSEPPLWPNRPLFYPGTRAAALQSALALTPWRWPARAAIPARVPWHLPVPTARPPLSAARPAAPTRRSCWQVAVPGRLRDAGWTAAARFSAQAYGSVSAARRATAPRATAPTPAGRPPGSVARYREWRCRVARPGRRRTSPSDERPNQRRRPAPHRIARLFSQPVRRRRHRGGGRRLHDGASQGAAGRSPCAQVHGAARQGNGQGAQRLRQRGRCAELIAKQRQRRAPVRESAGRAGGAAGRERDADDLQLHPREGEPIGQAMSKLDRYIKAATRDNTRQSYHIAIEHFEVAWGGLLPATADSVARYLADHAETLAVSTLRQRLAALAQWHSQQGFVDPTKTPIVRQTMRGIQTLHPAQVKRAKPFQLDQLDQVDRWLTASIAHARAADHRADELRHKRNRAFLLLGFWRGFRGDELTRLRIEHVEVASGEGMVCFLPRTKGDRQMKGGTFRAPALSRLCPVTAYQDWIAAARLDAGPVFGSVDRWGNIGDAALHIDSLVPMLRGILNGAAVAAPELYSAHSLRRGFASWAAANGWDLKTLMEHVGWKNAQSAMRYIDSADPFNQRRIEALLTAS
uniref:Tyr recombinase domain-containing protein n=1 Tax=Tanacetum cinerariifolium TaxID=118510 RepID=A0A699GI60_TANCI|nr:hypothetical protein [Tanacetum cinerariifolium]